MKFQFYKQRDSMSCGISCLAMICEAHGRKIPLSRLESLCTPTTDGVSIKGIYDAAKYVGLESMSMILNISELTNEKFPCVLYWNQNHFVVLYKRSKNGRRFWIADPAKGKYSLSIEELKRNWINTSNDNEGRGIAMFFEPTADFFNNNYHHSKHTRSSFHFLLNYIKRYRKIFLHIIIGLIFGCLLQLLMPFLTQAIVDVGIKNQDIGFIWLILIGELMIILGRTATDFIRRWLLLHITSNGGVGSVA